LLAVLAKLDQTPSQIVHLWGVGETEGSRSIETASDRYLLPLVRLAQALIDEEPSGAVELVVVTSGADGAGHDACPRFPLKALAQGPVRVIPREMPSIACRSVDLPGVLGSAQLLARALSVELEGQVTDTRVALRDGDRFVEVYERWRLTESGETWQLRPRGVVLMTGGLGGMALALAERLARTSQTRFVLVGRTTMPPREDWADLVARLDPDDPIVARIQGIQAIETAGGAVLVVAADAADPQAMRRVVAEGEARFGKINAAIHAAGVIEDAPLHSKERRSIEAVLRPKVAGAVALVEALRGRPLDFLAFFSSTSAVLGPAGQVDYVGANSFLTAYARQLAAEGIPARAIEWGAWQQVGMAAAALAPSHAPGAERVEHPLLQRRVNDAGGNVAFSAILDSRWQWVLDQHRVRGADPVLPGSGFVEMVRAALVTSGLASAADAIELSDVTLTAPLIVPEKTPCRVETAVRQEADGSAIVVIKSETRRDSAIDHATARGRGLTDWVPGKVDITAIEARCTLRFSSFKPGEQQLPQERLLAFGPRWKVVRTMAFGRDEAIAHLELAEEFAGDLDLYGLHPALLDMATGFAFTLLEGTSADSSLFAPLSYGRLRTTQRLPRRLISHVRRQPGSDAGTGVLDATLADEQGRVVLEIEGYVVKAVDHRVLRGVRKADAAPTPLERWVEHGILPDEGFDLLGRVMAQETEVQVLVSPLDLPSMIAELRPPEKPVPAAGALDASASAAADVDASQAGAPRDEIEQKLAGFWSELLDVDTVRLQDGFFDLGGHSLTAVRLFARIRKTWGADLPLATLFRAPTLETLAAAVRERLGLSLEVTAAPAAPAASTDTQAGWTPLVAIRKAGSRRPFFCVHGAGGNLLNFRDFVQRLDPEQPVYGLEARGVDGQLPPATSIEEMADLYLEAIRGVQSHGPYVLGGYSGGGVVALEIARRLAAVGERTTHVVLLDTFHPATEARGLGWRNRVDGFVEGLVANGLGFLRSVASAAVTRHVSWSRQDRHLRECLERGEPVPHELREWYITTSFVEALRHHVPAPYSGRVTLFRARDIAQVYDHLGPRLGWTLTELPNLDVIEVPGGHDSLVREPNVRILSEGLEALLSKSAQSPAAR
jgi:thioesterase domain-containing protein/NAD(P)-dependent dehydrogenase (short-subunit alcohol dehydrogenase family)